MNLSQALRWTEHITYIDPLPQADIWLKLNGTDVPALSLPAQSQYITDSKFGTVLQFDNSDVFANGVNSDRYIPNKTYEKLTIAGWFKSYNNNGALSLGFCRFYRNDLRFSFSGYPAPGTTFAYNGYAEYIPNWSSITGETGRWNFYAAVYDFTIPQTCILYFNSQPVYYPAVTSAITGGENPCQFCFGSYSVGGQMSNVRAFVDKALTQEEVSALYHEFD